MTQPSCRRQRGFTLLELASALTLTAGLIFALAYKTVDVTIQRSNQAIAQSLALADEQLRHFAAREGRFPCPDTDANGIEDCQASTAKGYLPYRTLGLAANSYQPGEIPLRYGIYRNAGIDADLAVSADRFNPTNADNTTYQMGNRSSLDLCVGLQQAAQQGPDTRYIYQQRPDGTQMSMAYMLAAAGERDADGSLGPFDGLNASDTPGFLASEAAVSADYDDLTRGRSFNELFSLLRCDVTLRSLDLAANAIALEEEVVAFAKSNQDTAAQGKTMGIVGTSIAVWNGMQAGAALAAANTALGIASTQLGAATAGCAVPPFATCALIPVYTPAVAAATTGVTLSGVALGFSVGAFGGQLAATIMYDDIAGKTGVPDNGGSSPGLDPQRVNDALDNYKLKQAEADAAAAEYSAANADYLASKTDTDSAHNAFKDQLQSEFMIGDTRTKLEDQIYGNPRPADVDPEHPPDKDSVIPGAAPALDAWRQMEGAALALGDTELVDENGNSLTGAGGSIDLAANAEKARIESQKQQDKAIALSNAYCNSADPIISPCTLADKLNAYLAAYSEERRLAAIAENKRVVAENKQGEAEGAYDGYGGLNCAVNNQDYDAENNVCTSGAPGSGAQDQAQQQMRDRVCDTNKDTYDADACASLSRPATGEVAPVTFTRGAEDIVKLLDAKGTLE